MGSELEVAKAGDCQHCGERLQLHRIPCADPALDDGGLIAFLKKQDAAALADEIDHADRVYSRIAHRYQIAEAKRKLYSSLLSMRQDVWEIVKQRRAERAAKEQ